MLTGPGAAGAAGRVVRQLLRRGDALPAAVRPIPAPLCRLLPTGGHGVQRKVSPPTSDCGVYVHFDCYLLRLGLNFQLCFVLYFSENRRTELF